MKARTPHLILALSLLATLSVLSCGDDDSTGPPAPDPGGAAAKVQQANAALERILNDELNAPDPERPSDVDLREPYALYNEALALDGTNLDAHFGVAVTGLLVLSVDQEVNEAFDEWKAYLDDHVPFEDKSKPGDALGIPLTFTRGRDALRLPFDLVPLTLVAQARTALLPVDPQIERVQQILATRVLPRLVDAQSHLNSVAANAAYRFTVTPRMQGDDEADPAEIDQTDILALRAGCALLAGACRVAVSYQLNLAAYDSLSLYESFRPGSGWMALRSGGADQMAAARTDVLRAVDDVDLAITALLAERDSQDDDVIKIGPDDLSRAEVESVRVHLPHAREAMNSGYVRIDDWDDRSATPDTPLRINVGNLLSHPPADWKALLPSYTVRVERRTWEEDWEGGSGQVQDTVTAPGSGSFWGSYAMRFDEGTIGYEGFNGDPFLRGALMRAAEARHASVAGLPGWSGYLYCQTSFSGQLSAGNQSIQIAWYDSYSLILESVFIPVLVWEAANFGQWSWPDPTLAGLLPEMGSTAELLTTFGYTGEDWEPELALDWAGEQSVPPTPPPPPPPPPPTTGRISGSATLPVGTTGDLSNARVAIYMTWDDWNNSRPLRVVSAEGAGQSVSFLITLIPPGTYYLDVWKDVNLSGHWDTGDFIGVHGTTQWPPSTLAPIMVAAGQTSAVMVLMIAVP